MTEHGQEPVLGILVSGRGSNMEAIIAAVEGGRVGATIGIVLSDTPEALALDKARTHGIPAVAVPRSEHAPRRVHEAALVAALDEASVTHVALAGFMRVLSSRFVARYQGRLVNVHPALLPSFPGLDGQRQALEHGVKVAGCTVHFVDAGVDTGPIIAQAAVPVLDDDTEASLSARILEEEHTIYPRAIAALVAGRLTIEGRRVRWSP